MSRPEHIVGYTTHARRGAITNAFRYGVDYVLIDPDSLARPKLFSRNARNLFSVRDKDHGGAPGAGNGIAWVHGVLSDHPMPFEPHIRLLTQPALMGFVFNPVSFWLIFDGAAPDANLRAVIAEVTNTFGDRHSYLCKRDDFAPIEADHKLESQKIFHVSPFQKRTGTYAFNFDIRPDKINIRILLTRDDEGVIATLSGPRAPMSNRSLLRAGIRRPFGAVRVLALIHWQAVKLKLKGAEYRRRPAPPTQEVSS